MKRNRLFSPPEIITRDPVAQQHWRHVMRTLRAEGRIGPGALGLVTELCLQWAAVVRATEQWQEAGNPMLSANDLKPHPLIAARRDAFRAYRACCKDLGLSVGPLRAGERKVAAGKPAEPTGPTQPDPWATFEAETAPTNGVA